MVRTELKYKAFLVIFGILIFLLALEISLRLCGWVILYSQSNYDYRENNGEIRILALGESTTAPLSDENWPKLLEDILNNGSGKKYKVFNEGIPGTTTAFILMRLQDNLDKYHPDIVISMMGINDKLFVLKYKHTYIDKIKLLFADFRVVKLGVWIKNSLYGSSSNESNDRDSMAVKQENYPLIASKDPRVSKLISQANNISGLDVQKSIILLNEAIKLEPDYYLSYASLGSIYWRQGRYQEAEIQLRDSLRLYDDYNLYWVMADNFFLQGKLDDSIYYYKAYLEHYPNAKTYGDLAQIYLMQRKFNESRYYFEKMTEYEAEDPTLITSFSAMRSANVSDERIDKFIKRKWPFIGLDLSHNSSEITKYHYQKVYELLDSEDITYIAMGYPTYNTGYLKDLFENQREVIIVSNEENFKKALSEGKYETYFIDNFGGTFGHATSKGNLLIAENAAETILKATK